MKWSVGTKIGVSFGLVLAVFVTIGIISYRSLVVLIEATNWRQHSYEVLNHTGDVLSSLKDAETGQRGFVMTGQERYLDPYNAAVPLIAKEMTELRDITADNPRQQHFIDALEPLIADKLSELQETIELRKNTGLESALKVVLTDRGKKAMDRVREVLLEMGNEEESLLKARTEEAAATTRETQSVIVLGIAFAALFLASAGFFLTRNIARPLGDISRMAEQIATGDLSGEMTPDDRSDEVGTLGRTFDRMTKALRKMAGLAEEIAAGNLKIIVQPQSSKDLLSNSFATMVQNLSALTSQIVEAVGVLGSSATEILASTTETASGATETATSVTETTATVEEIRQTARVASQKAKHVADSAQQATQISQEGKKLTEETVTGMHRIREQMAAIAESMVRLSEQSRAIGEIISSVDDLAQQSNLLAVNAAIEAAKAGEQGKGFTVVAQEVKSLAEQSKRATSQVRGLLNDIQKATGEAAMATEQGTKAVEIGVQQSAQAGETILALTASVTQAEQAALQIAASSQQQLAGMDQVAIAMGSIKEATLQNAAATKQVETAARNVNELGHQLKQLISRFKL